MIASISSVMNTYTLRGLPKLLTESVEEWYCIQAPEAVIQTRFLLVAGYFTKPLGGVSRKWSKR